MALKHRVKKGDTNEFGYATIEEVTNRKDKNGCTILVCRCCCGNKFETTIPRWNNSRTMSCGCKSKVRHIETKPFQKGRQGHLTILESGIVKPSGKRVARCICDCDPTREIEIAECDLRKGAKSCGCRGRVANGQVFGRLTVLDNSLIEGTKKMALVRCSCDRHTEFVASQECLKKGNVKSCGCLQREAVTRHGESRMRLYGIWKGMKDRCSNERSHYAKWYLKKGIGICPQWRDDYLAFRDWAMTNGYAEDLTIDRIDYAKGYSPENCRWVSRKVQSNNKSDNVTIEYEGERLTVAQWAERKGMDEGLIRGRLRLGWTADEIFSTKDHKTRGWRKRE